MTHSGREVKGTVQDHDDLEVSSQNCGYRTHNFADTVRITFWIGYRMKKFPQTDPQYFSMILAKIEMKM